MPGFAGPGHPWPGGSDCWRRLDRPEISLKVWAGGADRWRSEQPKEAHRERWRSPHRGDGRRVERCPGRGLGWRLGAAIARPIGRRPPTAQGEQRRKP